MVDLLVEAASLEQLLEKFQWRFCFIGGIAVQHWGEPRLTRNLDVALLTGFGHEEEFVDRLLVSYESRISGARKFASSRRVLLLRSETGIGIDISLAALPFEESAVNRATNVEMLAGTCATFDPSSCGNVTLSTGAV